MKALITTILLIFSAVVSAAPKANLWSFWQTSQAQSATVDHRVWQTLLDRYLDSQHASGINRFDYAAVDAQSRQQLQQYLQTLQQLDPRQLTRAEQKAYWINLYNVLTVHAVLAAYPVSSILKVDGGIFNRGPWNKKYLQIAGQSLSLNDIEHRILRPIFNDSRIHFAVNCASLGCPNLLPQAFTAANTEQLLQQAALAYLQHPRGLQMLANGDLRLSKIFDWYQLDFADTEAGLVQALLPYLPAKQQQRLQNFGGQIYYAYDWSLNAP